MDWRIEREFIQAQRKCGYNSILLWKLQFPTATVDRRLFSVLSRSAVRQTTGEGCQRDTSYVTLVATSWNMCKRCFNTLYKVWRLFNPNCCYINLKTNLENVVFCLYPKQKQEQQQKLKLKLKLWDNCSICRFHRRICTRIHKQIHMYYIAFSLRIFNYVPPSAEKKWKGNSNLKPQTTHTSNQTETYTNYLLFPTPHFWPFLIFTHTYFLIVFGASWIIPEFIFFYCFATKSFVVKLWQKIGLMFSLVFLIENRTNCDYGMQNKFQTCLWVVLNIIRIQKFFLYSIIEYVQNSSQWNM